MLDMFAFMLNIHSKQSETKEIKTEINQNSARLNAVEATIGGTNEVSEKPCLAVRQLAGFQIRTFFAQFSTFFGWFFLPNFGALGMVLRLGMVTTCLPKARDGHHMSA